MNARPCVYMLAAVGGLGAAGHVLGGPQQIWFNDYGAFLIYTESQPAPHDAAESFEECILAPALIASLPDPRLRYGVPNGPFPMGMTAGLRMCVEANENRTMGSTQDPRLTAGALAAASASAGTYTSDVVLTNVSGDSMDLVFDDTTVSVGIDVIASFFSTTVHIRVFDSSGVEMFPPPLLGWESGTTGPDGSLFRGVASTDPARRIGRINISTDSQQMVGADNVRAQWVQVCGSADFNCDGDRGTDADIAAFFACLAGTCPAPPCRSTADFNDDGDVGTDADIAAFFRVLAGGAC
jgi:hypothetical protein